MSFFGMGPEDVNPKGPTDEELANDLYQAAFMAAFRGGDPEEQIKRSAYSEEVKEMARRKLRAQKRPRRRPKEDS